ncbi:MAG: HPr family phosphocarrier protein [Pygmaiobacter sp.]
MKSFTFTITDPLGIHARPAGLLVKQVAAFQSSATIATEAKSVDARRLMAVMGLGAKTGTAVTMTFEGADEEAAATALEAFCRETLAT